MHFCAKMNTILQRNKIFYLPILISWVILSFIIIKYDKALTHLYLNQFHNSFFDTFFKWTTFLGDGVFLAVISLLFLLYSFRKSFTIGLGGIFAGVFAQSLKKLVFNDALRPKAFFENISELYLVPGVEVHDFFSFPSGHTTTAFCLFFILSYFTENRLLKVFYLICALVAGYSRIYLSQHFLVDVYFGAIFGIISAILAIYIFSRVHSVWLDKSIITILKKK